MTMEELQIWSRNYGVENFHGACSFTYNDDFGFRIEATEGGRFVMLSSTIATVSIQSESDLFRQLLRWNHLGVKTQGASFSLDETGENIVLWIMISIDDLDPAEFDRVVGSFLDLSEQFAKAVRQMDESNIAEVL
ncbi:type III secretion system chaperone [Thalassoglobus sp. JC818]|uniref:type III secretion system chaperone n=1 Tax=Thalassoglobus sp. JC818 TaxID=3232136 RepID=UPI00345A773C